MQINASLAQRYFCFLSVITIPKIVHKIRLLIGKLEKCAVEVLKQLNGNMKYWFEDQYVEVGFQKDVIVNRFIFNDLFLLSAEFCYNITSDYYLIIQQLSMITK